MPLVLVKCWFGFLSRSHGTEFSFRSNCRILSLEGFFGNVKCNCSMKMGCGKLSNLSPIQDSIQRFAKTVEKNTQNTINRTFLWWWQYFLKLVIPFILQFRQKLRKSLEQAWRINKAHYESRKNTSEHNRFYTPKCHIVRNMRILKPLNPVLFSFEKSLKSITAKLNAYIAGKGQKKTYIVILMDLF